MKNLYTFSKNSWHVKFFKWLFKEDPTKMYKTMCPYFWTYVLVVLFLPIILIIKAFGKAGTGLLNKLRTYKKRKEDRIRKRFIERLYAVKTNEEGYKLRRSKCWSRFEYDLGSYDHYQQAEKVRDMYRAHRRELDRKKDEKYEKRELITYQRREERSQKQEAFQNKIAESKIVKVLGYVFLYAGILALAYGAFELIWWLTTLKYPAPNWRLIGLIAAIIGGGAAVFFIGWALIRYILIPFFTYVACQLGKVNWSFLSYLSYLKYLGIPFWLLFKVIIKMFIYIGKFFAIIGSMIYATYKKHCPIITWKE